MAKRASALATTLLLFIVAGGANSALPRPAPKPGRWSDAASGARARHVPVAVPSASGAAGRLPSSVPLLEAVSAPTSRPRQPQRPPARASASAGSAVAATASRKTSKPKPQPVPPPVVTPRIASAPSLPAAPPGLVRLLTTPRARVVLSPRVSDPTQIVAASGRLGCTFSFRSIAGGIVEYLLPISGLFHRGDPLFRLYDPAILADLQSVEQLLQDRDVRPLLIAGPPPRRPVPRGLVPGGLTPSGAPITSPFPDFPSPYADRQVPTVRVVPPPAAPNQTAPATVRAQREAAGDTDHRPRSHARPKLAPRPRPATAPARNAPYIARAPRSQQAKLDLGPYQEAVATAKAAYERAQAEVTECEEDYAAKKRLVELGALAEKVLEASASRLEQARSEASEAQVKLRIAQERLAAEQERAQQAGAHQPSEPDAAADVQVIRGTEDNASQTGVEVVRGTGDAEEGRGVDVYRGEAPPPEERAAKASTQHTAHAAPNRSETARSPSLPLGPLRIPRSGPTRRVNPPADYPTRAGGAPGTELISRSFPPRPVELDRLVEQRYTEYRAPTDGFAVARSAQNGALIAAGQELLKVINTQWARAFLTVAVSDAHRFEPGTTVSVTFDDYPDVAFEGWVNSLEPERDRELFRAEIVVFCHYGYFDTDALATLQWLALATPLEENTEQVAPLEAVIEDSPERHYRTNPQARLSLVPKDIWVLSVDESELKRSKVQFEGQLQVVEYSGPQDSGSMGEAERKRLQMLKRWREGFVAGMTRTKFAENVILTYPKSGEIRRAIERMATGEVTHIPNRCARTVREALGWGLGDAHVWAERLPSCGYVARRDGLARPGDILVWPFTYPPRGSQHIGIAVQQNGKLMLLSNLNGRLGTTEIEPGYIAFYKPS